MFFLGPFLLKSADLYAEELYTYYDNFNPQSWFCFVKKVDTNIRDSNLLVCVAF